MSKKHIDRNEGPSSRRLLGVEQALEQALAEATEQAGRNRAILDSLTSHLAVLDRNGTIVAVNVSWKEFASSNAGESGAETGEGANYLETCQMASGQDPDARRALDGIRSVLDGSHDVFQMEYPCHGPEEKRWFIMTVIPLKTEQGGAVIAHDDVSELVQKREELKTALADLAALKDQLAAENVYLQEELREDLHYRDIVGESEPWLNVISQVKLVAKTESTVLLHGETGTGKELLARALHAESSRSHHPVIKINCATLPSTLIESELFGHEKGAFSGADRQRQGRFEIAHRGTLFLDEIGELPLELQAKLLTVLQTGEFERLGSSKTLHSDVRVIAATNRNLSEEVEAGRFRSDLYYRLAVFPIEVPPLRDRRDDIPLLTMFFLSRLNATHAKSIDSVSNETMAALAQYDWPGNVRELENLIERAVILSPGSTLNFSTSMLTGAPFPSIADVQSHGNERAPVATEVPGGSVTLRDVEHDHILAVLESCSWKVKGKGNAAERLGLKESTLRARMNKLGIRRPGA